MQRFLMLYIGPRPTNPAHEGWPDWFEKIGAALVDMGSPLRNGFVLHSDGSTSDVTSPPLGYGIVEAEDRAGALDLLRDHPLWLSGDEYVIEVFEVPRR
jgi:hypothetical protein